MKSPIDIVRGRIVDIDKHGIVTIKARYDDWPMLLKREYKECNIQMIDSRPLSDKQRRTCYKLIREISNYTGMGLDPTKEYMKLKFIAEDLQETADQMFSLSNAPMSLVCAFQRFLVRFILDWDIPCSFSLLDFVDDVQDYDYVYPHLYHATDKIIFEHERERLEGVYAHFKDAVQDKVADAMQNVQGLTGQWSVDVLMDEREKFWLIDMAIAQRSAYWEMRPEGYAE